MSATCTTMYMRWFAALCIAVSDAEIGENMTKIVKEKLTYCFITCNLNQLPKLLCDNRDTAAAFFNYFHTEIFFFLA